MEAAASAHLALNPGDVDLSCDAESAFYPGCRTKAWDELRSKFPSLYALGRLLYGSAASISFGEEGVGVSEVPNSVGSRQGCSCDPSLPCRAGSRVS